METTKRTQATGTKKPTPTQTNIALLKARQAQEERKKAVKKAQENRTQATGRKDTQDTNNVNTFVDLLRSYETHTTKRTQATEIMFTKSLTDLATAVVYSVLKKCIETSMNKSLIQIKQSIAQDKQHLINLNNSVNKAYGLKYNSKGELHTVVCDTQLHKDLEKIESVTLNNGTDLINDAVVSIMKETKLSQERNNGQYIENFMDTQYTVRRLKKKVYIKVEDSVKGWETVNTTPIQEVFKNVRRAIESNKSVRVDTTNGYSYLIDIAQDTETDTEETIYRRLPHYADLGCTVVDYNGKEVAYTVDQQTVEDTDTLIESLKLSTRQAKVLQLRMSGYGYKAIGTYLGIDSSNVTRVCKQIQKKAIEKGLTPKK